MLSIVCSFLSPVKPFDSTFFVTVFRLLLSIASLLFDSVAILRCFRGVVKPFLNYFCALLSNLSVEDLESRLTNKSHRPSRCFVHESLIVATFSFVSSTFLCYSPISLIVAFAGNHDQLIVHQKNDANDTKSNDQIVNIEHLAFLVALRWCYCSTIALPVKPLMCCIFTSVLESQSM